jgi:hypothetical protein
VIHSTLSKEATSTSPNKQLASIRTFQERAATNTVSTTSHEEAKLFKIDHHPQPSGEGTGNSSHPSQHQFRGQGPVIFFIEESQKATIRYPTASANTRITSRPTHHHDLAFLWFQSSFNRHNSATGSQSQSQSQNGQPIFQTGLVLDFRPEPESKATTCLHENKFWQQYAQHDE